MTVQITKSIFMNTKITRSLKGLIIICLLCFPHVVYSATASVLITITNIVQTNANTFEYDVLVTNTASDTIKLRGYSWGLNVTPGLENGGTLTHSFINRDPLFNNLPVVNYTYTAAFHHLRGLTINAPAGNEVSLIPNIVYKLARMSVHTTAPCWLGNFNPFMPAPPSTPIQMVTESGHTHCFIVAIVSPPDSSYAINGILNTAAPGTIQGLTGTMIPDPLGTTPFLLNCACAIYDTTTTSTCDSYMWSVNAQTYTASGSYTNTLSSVGACDSVSILNLTVSPLNLATTLSGITMTSSATGVSYQWISCGNNAPMAGATNQNYTPSINGNYAVIVSNGICTDTSACRNVSAVGLHETVQSDDVHVYPNPGSGIFTIELYATSSIMMTDVMGNILLNETMTAGKHMINLSNNAKGIYVLKSICSDTYYTMKLVNE